MLILKNSEFERVEGHWQPLRELNFNYSGIPVTSVRGVSTVIPHTALCAVIEPKKFVKRIEKLAF